MLKKLLITTQPVRMNYALLRLGQLRVKRTAEIPWDSNRKKRSKESEKSEFQISEPNGRNLENQGLTKLLTPPWDDCGIESEKQCQDPANQPSAQ